MMWMDCSRLLTRNRGIHWKTLLLRLKCSSVQIDFTGSVGRLSCWPLESELAKAKAITTKDTKVHEGKAGLDWWTFVLSWLRILGFLGSASLAQPAAQHRDRRFRDLIERVGAAID